MIRTLVVGFDLNLVSAHMPLLINLLISNNFSSMTFFCATRILRVIGCQSIRQSTDFFTGFLA